MGTRPWKKNCETRGTIRAFPSAKPRITLGSSNTKRRIARQPILRFPFACIRTDTAFKGFFAVPMRVLVLF